MSVRVKRCRASSCILLNCLDICRSPARSCQQMTEEDAEEKALADVLIEVVHEESDREHGFFWDPCHAAEHPDKFFTEVRSMAWLHSGA